jgi:hypothetical protein
MILIKLFYSAKLKYWVRIALAVFIQLFSSFPYLYLIVNTLESYLKIEFSIVETCAINFIAVIPQIVIFYLLVDRAQMKYTYDVNIYDTVKKIGNFLGKGLDFKMELEVAKQKDDVIDYVI